MRSMITICRIARGLGAAGLALGATVASARVPGDAPPPAASERAALDQPADARCPAAAHPVSRADLETLSLDHGPRATTTPWANQQRRLRNQQRELRAQAAAGACGAGRPAAH